MAGAIYVGASGPYLGKLAVGDTFRARRTLSAVVEPSEAGRGEYLLAINSPGGLTVTLSNKILVPKGQLLRVAETFPEPDPGERPVIIVDMIDG